MKLIILLLIISGLLFSSGFEDHNEKHINKELSHLNLSQEQNEKIKEILKEFKRDLKEYRSFKENIDDGIKKVFIKDSFNKEELNKLYNELYEKTKEIEIKLLKNIHTVLSRKQREEFTHYFDEWKVE
ncbi:hypothetical protein [Sulfurimonas sp.]|uniref:hypothetical protein n=1 Tax=Sulfurimonas sp. TaxID=2022749 RepID=UPI00286DA26B|nr:hypothetical protein [Sulfurimonas sp.]